MRIILEGITGTGKTTLLQHLGKKLIDEEGDNFISFSQFYTSTIGYKIKEDSIRHMNILSSMDSIMELISQYDKLYKNYHTDDDSRKVNAIIESFHFENIAKGLIPETFFDKYDLLCSNHDFLLVLLTIPDREILERSILLTKKYRNSKKWNLYLESISDNNIEIEDYFRHMQESFIALYKKSNMKKININTSNMKWNKISDFILDEYKKSSTE